MPENNQKIENDKDEVYFTKIVKLVYDQKIGFGKVLDTLSKDFNYTLTKKEDGSIILILTPKNNG
jgi:hypothetical protein